MSSEIGTWIGGRYQLVELAGEGGMATVYRAVMHGAVGFTRPVAIKKIKPEFRAIQNYTDMFIEEARVGSELAHTNIVQVYDFLRDDDGAYYLVMEWIEGMDLWAYVYTHFENGSFTPWAPVVAIGVGALRGLSAAHERRRADGEPAPVIHRDVSPHNILLGLNGAVKLTDFGLARARDRMFSLTAPGTVKGKLSYLSPELTRGHQATALSDQFSMASVLWEALCGRRPFAGASDLEVFQNIRTCNPARLTTVRRDLPERLVHAVHRALAPNPANRFPSARAMADELADLLKASELGDTFPAELGDHLVQVRERATEGGLTWDPGDPDSTRAHEREPTVEIGSAAMIEVHGTLPPGAATAAPQKPAPAKPPAPPRGESSKPQPAAPSQSSEPPKDPLLETIPLFRKK